MLKRIFQNYGEAENWASIVSDAGYVGIEIDLSQQDIKNIEDGKVIAYQGEYGVLVYKKEVRAS